MSKKAQEERTRKAAETLAQLQASEKRRRNLNIGGVVAVVLVLVVVGFLVTRGRDDTTKVTAAAAGSTDYGVTIGPATAPHKVVVYEDFLCPFCGELEKKTHEQLATLADAGKVQVDYRPFHLLDPDYSSQSANAFKVVLDAAGPVVAKTFHDELYADQPDESGPFPDTDWFVKKAVDAGADESKVRDGIENMSQQAWVDAATKAAFATGLKGTPTILLDGKVFTEGTTLDDNAAALIAAVS